jgi:plastocyanin
VLIKTNNQLSINGKGVRMKARTFLAIVACVGLVFITFNTTMAKEEGMQTLAGHQVIRVHYGTGLNPETLKVNRGTTVIWVNEAMTPVSIMFLDKEITTACENPVNFTKDAKGGFTAKQVKFGAVASICFIEKGTYKYKVKRPTRMVTEVQKGKIEKGSEYEGTIIVE